MHNISDVLFIVVNSLFVCLASLDGVAALSQYLMRHWRASKCHITALPVADRIRALEAQRRTVEWVAQLSLVLKRNLQLSLLIVIRAQRNFLILQLFGQAP